MNLEIEQTNFNNWIDDSLNKHSIYLGDAIHFNIYEFEDCIYGVQMVNANYDSSSDWCCDELLVFEDYYYIQDNDLGWRQVLSQIKCLLEKYLLTGNNADILNSFSVVSMGFVDGDIEYIKNRTEILEKVNSFL